MSHKMCSWDDAAKDLIRLDCFLAVINPAAQNASFGGDKFTVNYQVPISSPSESALIMFQEVRSLPRVLDTVLAIISPNALFADREWRPPVCHCHWHRNRWFTRGASPLAQVGLLCKKGVNYPLTCFCCHRGQRRTDGVVRRSLPTDVFLMCFKCRGWEEVKRAQATAALTGVLSNSQLFLHSVNPAEVQALKMHQMFKLLI